MFQSFAPLQFENKTVMKCLLNLVALILKTVFVTGSELKPVQKVGLEIRQHLKHFY